MKHLKSYKQLFEAVIMPSELKSVGQLNTMDKLIDFGRENNFDVVGYDEFYNSLNDDDKKTAPKNDRRIPFFAIFHPERKKAMFVLCDPNVLRFMPMEQIVTDIISHELIHATQNQKRGGLTFTLPNPAVKKEYFSNSDEVMAFAYTIAKSLKDEFDSIEDCMKELGGRDAGRFRFGGGMPPVYKKVWEDIRGNCDENTIKKYRKYIFQYLEKMFNKKEETNVHSKINKRS